MKKHKMKNLALFVTFAASLGAVAGAVVWGLLRVMAIGINFVWTTIPAGVGNEKVYTLAVCLLGGLIIGLWQRKFGILPDSLETVMTQLKETGTYPYNRLHILGVSALLPLFFGGSLGPEAGLTGIIVGLCCWIGDNLKYKSSEVRELANAGMAATLGIIFNAPFYGIANNLEEKDFSSFGGKNKENEESIFDDQEKKRVKIMIYIAAILGGFGAMGGLGKLFGGGMGIPRFTASVIPTFHDWIWFVPLLILGVLYGMIYVFIDRLTSRIGEKLGKYRIISCILAGLCLGLMGSFFPLTMFSGEEQMGEIMRSWTTMSGAFLIGIGLLKLITLCICVNLGWRGGNIFPIIFAGTCLGYGMAAITGINPIFAVAVSTACLCAYVMRKPMTAVAVLLLCFPIKIIIPLAIAAYVGSTVPILKLLMQKKEMEK
ncbi:MAG: chloride channel protein [Anaerovoracaceae bacterium]